jgi:hypothetical protein
MTPVVDRVVGQVECEDWVAVEPREDGADSVVEVLGGSLGDYHGDLGCAVVETSPLLLGQIVGCFLLL